MTNTQQTVSPARNTLSRGMRWMVAAVALVAGAHLGAADVVTVAGGGTGPGASGPATAASLAGPESVVTDPAGGYYVNDQGNYCVRHVDAAGNISVVAGIPGTSAFSSDGGLATATALDIPYAVALDGAGNLYIADQGRIREVNHSSGIITTIAGNGGVGYGGDGSVATSTSIYATLALAVDATGDVYFTDGNNNDVHMVGTNGLLSTVAGNGTAGYAGDGGSATAAELDDPVALCFDGQGALYIADGGNSTIRKVSGGIITSVVGNGTAETYADYAAGEVTSGPCATFPIGVAVDSDGAIYYADFDTETVREAKAGVIIDQAGCWYTGYNGDGPALSTYFYGISQIGLDQSGHLYIADADNDRVRELDVPLSTPVVTSAGTATGEVGFPFTYQISAGWSPSSYGASGLPAGLSVDSGSGIISGTPTATGSYATTISATNADGTGSASVNFTVIPPAPVITGAGTATATIGMPFSYQVTALNAPTAFAAAGLPAGLAIDAGTGNITGTPTVYGTFTVTLSATSASGTGTQALTLAIADIAPVITSATYASAVAGAPFSFVVTASDATTYVAAFPGALAADFSINAGTGVITATPGAADIGTGYVVPLTITGPGGSATANLILDVVANPPVFSGPTSATVASGSPLSFTVSATGATAYAATFPSAISSAFTIGATSGAIAGTPDDTMVGTWTVPVVASDAGGSATECVSLTIIQGVPVVTSATSAAGMVGAGFSYQITALHHPTAYSLTSVPAGLSLNGATGLVTGTPMTAGTYSVTVGATNATGTGYLAETWTIAPAVPVISSATSVSGNVNLTLNYQITATSSPTSYSVTGLPLGFGYSNTTGLISGTPSATGSFTATVSATNISGTGTQAVVFTIAPAILPPVITSNPTLIGYLNKPFSYQITATNNPTSFNAYLWPGLTCNTSTGLITGTPTSAGDGGIELMATNIAGTGTGGNIMYVYNSAPYLYGANTNLITLGSAFSYQITAYDGPQSYNATNLPPGVTINTTTGAISGTPTASGTYSIVLSATNPLGTGTMGYSLTVNPPAPVLTSATTASTSTGFTGSPFSYQITATNSPTSYALSSAPAWLSLNAGTGLISGTPTVSGTFTMTVTATNAGGSASQVVTISLAPITPVITSATTITGTTGYAFSYAITANYSPTTYGATPLPAGLAINSATGVISGTPTATGATAVTLSAGNSVGTGTQTLTITIQQPVPSITSPGTATCVVNTAFSYQITATNNPTSYIAANLPSWMYYNPTTGLISGTPTAVGTTTIVLEATNSTGTGYAKNLTITVTIPPPVITSAATSGALINGAWSYQITASNSPTSYGATGLPGGLSINTSTGLMSGTPTSLGSSTIAITATNAIGTGSQNVVLTVYAGSPVVTSAASVSGIIGTALTYQITATNSPTAYAASTLPAGLTLNASTGLISGTPTTVATTTVTVYANNPLGTGTASVTFTITPNFPVFTSATSASALVAIPFTYQITATQNPTTFYGSNLPVGFTVNSSTGVLSGTFTATGTYTPMVYAFAGGYGSSMTVTITVGAQPAPVITSATSAATMVGNAFTYQITATSAPTGFSATGLPAGLSVNTATGLISGTPTGAGTFTVTLGVTNAVGSAAGTLALSVTPPAPVITSATAAAATYGVAFSYQITATNSPTAYTATNLPPGVTVNTATGLISGIPTTTGSGTVTISATNAGGTGTASFVMTISNAFPPVITSATSAVATMGVAFSYQITATNSPTAYTATNLPPGVTVNTATGLISGAPTVTGMGTVTITATNVAGTGSGAFVLTISGGVSPPVITSPTSATATMGVAFSYQITATNSPTSYTATNLPSGVTVNTATGLISGAPTTYGTGTVTITATNSAGTGTGSFVITIAGPPLITSAASANGATYNPFTYTITAVNGPTSYGVTNLPAGLSVNAATGVISGTPTTVGTTTMTVWAYNAAGSGSLAVTVTIAAGAPYPPVITSGTSASVNEGSSLSYQITASPAATSYAATGLPSGLAINTTTGLISGSPTVTGSYTVGLSATDSYGTGTRSLYLTLLPPLAVITSANPVNDQVGKVMSYQITTSYPATSYSATGLPAGLSLNTSTGLVSGTPTTAGTVSATLTTSNAGGTSSRATTFTTAAANAPTITSAPTASGIQNVAFSYQITATNSPTSYAVSSLPSGLTLNSSTGLISGTPTVATTLSTTITATNAYGANHLLVTLTITGVPVISSTYTITTNVGSVFSGPTIVATNSPTSYGATNLPPGLYLSGNSILGTATTTGSWSVTVSATNAAGTGTKVWTINVLIAKPVITSAGTASGYIGVPFAYQITATGSPTMYACGTLPAGLTLNGATGLISGTPTVAVTNLSVIVEADNAGGYGYIYLSLTITTEPVPVVTSATAAAAQVGSAFSYQIAAINAPTAFTATGLPAGLAVDPVAGAITGTPTATGVSTVTISASNAGGTGSATLTITVASATPVITSATTDNATVGTVYSYQITASNLPTSYGATGLPDGLSVDPVAGTISGTPTTAGSWAVTVTATNDGGTGTITLVITVGASG